VNSNLTTNEIVGKNHFDLISTVFKPLAPPHLPEVTFTRGGQGVEKAIMTAIAQRELNNDSGTKYLAMGFRGCNHGIKASFVNNHFRGETKIPTFKWPLLDFPQHKGDESQVLD